MVLFHKKLIITRHESIKDKIKNSSSKENIQTLHTLCSQQTILEFTGEKKELKGA